MTSAGAPAPQAREAAPMQSSTPPIAPYHPPPSYPPPATSATQALDNRSAVALVLAVLGLVPGLPLGPIAYFMGKSAVARIDASAGALEGRNFAMTAWILGIVATAAGAVVSLVWLVVILNSASGPTS